MRVFDFEDYRIYLKNWLRSRQQNGRGYISKISRSLNIHSTLFSLILSGDRDLTLEHGFALTNYLELNELESDYFMLLVQLSRAGNHNYKKNLLKKIEKAKKDAQNLATRFDHEKKLDPEERAIFYSSWLYSAIRLYCSTEPEGRSIEDIIEHFNLKRVKVISFVDWLLEKGLLKKEKEKYTLGIQRTFLEKTSPLLGKHHTNWRLKSLQRFDDLTNEEIMFTSPMSISKSDFDRLREMLAELIKKSSDIIKDSPAEDVACLNIDFFWVK